MELIKPQKQKVWKWPAAINFTFGGLGTGMYILAWLANAPAQSEWLSLFLAGNANWLSIAFSAGVFKLIGLILATLGFLALTTEAGRPLRGINLFRHMRRSWMSRETLAFFTFGALGGLDWLFPNATLRALAVVAALALVLCQGMIVYRARGVTAWNTPLMPWYFGASAWSSGAGLYVLVASVLGVPAPNQILFFTLVGALVNVAVWLVYLYTSNGYFRAAVRELRQTDALLLGVGVGHILPALLLAVVTFANFGLGSALVAASGACLVIGAFTQKFGIIMRAGYLRAILLKVRA